MVDLFCILYNKINNKNNTLSIIRYYSFIRLTIRITANILIPIYFKISNIFLTYHLNVDLSKNKARKIISLTSFPSRINKIWIVIECLLRQKTKPDLIILWLSKDEFKNNKLPKSLQKLQKRGLVINYVEDNLRSHKKYYYTLKYYPNDILVTVDDDIFYSSNMLKNLLEFHKKYPKSICCHRAYIIKKNKKNISPYNTWKLVKEQNNEYSNLFFTSGGGTLFPPNTLYKDTLKDDIFKELCLFADDVWLNAMSNLNKTTITKTTNNSNILPIIYTNNIKLSSLNVHNCQNDIQINNLINYYAIENLKPF